MFIGNTVWCSPPIEERQIFRHGNDTAQNSSSLVKTGVRKKRMVAKRRGECFHFQIKCCGFGLRL